MMLPTKDYKFKGDTSDSISNKANFFLNKSKEASSHLLTNTILLILL